MSVTYICVYAHGGEATVDEDEDGRKGFFAMSNYEAWSEHPEIHSQYHDDINEWRRATFIYYDDFANWISSIRGKVILIMLPCGSGAMVDMLESDIHVRHNDNDSIDYTTLLDRKRFTVLCCSSYNQGGLGRTIIGELFVNELSDSIKSFNVTQITLARIRNKLSSYSDPWGIYNTPIIPCYYGNDDTIVFPSKSDSI